VAKQYRLTYAGYNSWLMPLNLAIGFHLVVALSVLFLPGLLKPKPKFEDIYTVNLVNIAEPVIEQSLPEPVAEPEVVPEPVVPKEAVSIAEPAPKPVVEAAPVEPISLKPLKRKVKKKIEEPKPPDRQKELDRLKRQALSRSDPSRATCRRAGKNCRRRGRASAKIDGSATCAGKEPGAEFAKDGAAKKFIQFQCVEWC
jgi:outer membrane biosynthesis protein TonB